jgi:hypothetical protein
VTADFALVQGDRSRPMEAILRDEQGPVDLSQADRVEFVMARDVGVEPIVEGEAEIDPSPTPELGRVFYHWGEGETDMPGRYLAHFRVFFSTQSVTFPSDRYLIVDILPNLQPQESPTP